MKKYGYTFSYVLWRTQCYKTFYFSHIFYLINEITFNFVFCENKERSLQKKRKKNVCLVYWVLVGSFRRDGQLFYSDL